MSDTARTWIGAMIGVSFAFYAPVTLWVATVPMLGMLMIPTTCAYVAIAIVASRGLFVRGTAPASQPAGMPCPTRCS